MKICFCDHTQDCHAFQLGACVMPECHCKYFARENGFVKRFFKWLRRIFVKDRGGILPQIHISPDVHYIPPGGGWVKQIIAGKGKIRQGPSRVIDAIPPHHIDCKFSIEEIDRLLEEIKKAAPVDSGILLSNITGRGKKRK